MQPLPSNFLAQQQPGVSVFQPQVPIQTGLSGVLQGGQFGSSIGAAPAGVSLAGGVGVQQNSMLSMLTNVMKLMNQLLQMSMGQQNVAQAGTAGTATPQTGANSLNGGLNNNDLLNYVLGGSQGGAANPDGTIDGRFMQQGSRFTQVGANEFDAAVAKAYTAQFKGQAMGLDVVFTQGQDTPQKIANNLETAINTPMTEEAELFSKVAAVYRGDIGGVGTYNNPVLGQLLTKWGRADIAAKPGVGQSDIESIGGVVQALNEEQNPATRKAWLQDIFDFQNNTPSSPSGAVPDAGKYQTAIDVVKNGTFDQLLNNFSGGGQPAQATAGQAGGAVSGQATATPTVGQAGSTAKTPTPYTGATTPGSAGQSAAASTSANAAQSPYGAPPSPYGGTAQPANPATPAAPGAGQANGGAYGGGKTNKGDKGGKSHKGGKANKGGGAKGGYGANTAPGSAGAPGQAGQTPGTQTPGTQTPGTQTPGTQTPGTQTPGTGNANVDQQVQQQINDPGINRGLDFQTLNTQQRSELGLSDTDRAILHMWGRQMNERGMQNGDYYLSGGANAEEARLIQQFSQQEMAQFGQINGSALDEAFFGLLDRMEGQPSGTFSNRYAGRQLHASSGQAITLRNDINANAQEGGLSGFEQGVLRLWGHQPLFSGGQIDGSILGYTIGNANALDSNAKSGGNGIDDVALSLLRSDIASDGTRNGNTLKSAFGDVMDKVYNIDGNGNGIIGATQQQIEGNAMAQLQQRAGNAGISMAQAMKDVGSGVQDAIVNAGDFIKQHPVISTVGAGGMVAAAAVCPFFGGLAVGAAGIGAAQKMMGQNQAAA